jgi:hypothetical protein
MKKLLNLLFVLVLATSAAFAQEHEMHCMIYKLPEQYLIQNSSLIVRAEVLSKESDWNTEKTRIYSYYQLKVYEDFNGNAPAYLTMVAEGGQVGYNEEQFADRIDFTAGDEVIVLLKQVPSHWKGIRRGNNQFSSWTSIQGVFRVDQHDQSLHDIFNRYENVDEFRGRVSHLTGRRPDVIAEKAKINNPIPPTSTAAVISGLSPSTVTAGTKTILTITGSGFGATRGNGFVEFRSIFLDGSFGRPLIKDYLFWSDTEIRLFVPSILTNATGDSPAATGPVRVTPDGGTAAQSAGNINVTYALLNVRPLGTDSAFSLVAGNFNALGAYTFQFNDQFTTTFGNTAKQTVERCFAKWRCATGFNWTLSATNTTVRTTGADGVNVITDDLQSPLPTGVGGRSLNHIQGCGNGANLKPITIQQDIIINNDPSSTNTTYSWNFGPGNPSFNQMDFETVLLHEIGHSHQITHTLYNSPTEVMAATLVNGVAKKNLLPNDIAAGLDVVNRSSVSVGCGVSPLSVSSPSITISTSTPLPVCATGSVVFTANTNGTAPVSALQWYVNGVAQFVGLGSTSFTYLSPQNGAVVTCGISGCSNTVSNSVTVSVTAIPSALFTYPSTSYCKNFSTAISPNITGASGGTFTSTPAGLSINSTTGAINAPASTMGTYTVTYSVTVSGCSNASTKTISIVNPATATIAYAGPYCKTQTTASTPTITGATGGSFSASPAGLTLNTSTGAITPSSSTAGTYTVTYTVAATSTCGAITATTSVIINAAPSASISYGASTLLCKLITTPVSCTITGTQGGTFSSSPAGLTLNASTGAITPSTSTVGTYTVTYTIAASGGCSAVTATRSITIENQLPTPAYISGTTTGNCGISRTFSTPAIQGAYNYQWVLPSGVTGSSTTNSITATFPANFTSGTISVRANRLTGCSSNFRSINVSGAPAQPGSFTGTNINTSTFTGTFTISAVSGATSYAWTITNGVILSGQGTTSVTVRKNTGAVSVTLCVRASNGCGTSAQRCSTYTLAPQFAPMEQGAGLPSTSEKNIFEFSRPLPTVFPNPAMDYVTLKFDELWYGTEVTAYLMNVEGKTLREFSFVPSGDETQQTDVSGLMPGMYMMRLQTTDSYQTVRFIKQ